MSSSSFNLHTSAAVMSLEDYIDSIEIPTEELESATNNLFADENLTKQTPSSKIYKGRLLQSSGEVVNIVAKICMQEESAYNEFVMLKDVRHKHIVPLFKFSQTDDIKVVLIFKHEANESLDKHLSTSLSWMQRLNICVGIARALKYLHYDAEEKHSVIHGNVKSSKILLDHNWEPKLHGCGSAVRAKRNQLYPTDNYEGSLQYMDPAYENTRGLTNKSDVFSFGVVLFEVLFGMEAASVPVSTPNYNDNWYFARMARAHYEKKTLDEKIDPNLRKQMSIESLNIFSEVAYYCLKERRPQRPDMKKVLQRLERALEHQRKHETPEHSENTSSNHSEVKNLDHLRIHLSDIRLATDNFSSTYCIGSGGYGRVYKAKLREKRGTVAIKRIFRREDAQAEQGFLAEIELLSKCNHPNIVSLIGFCNEEQEMILIYEFASNGSVEDYFGDSVKITDLIWPQRIQICIDIAYGLEYLHKVREDKECIIHRDIKSANILLDDKWGAKIADFGLSKLHPTYDQRSTFISENIGGTEVYIDPEYLKTGNLKTQSDIYSFGVVMCEMISGTLANDIVYSTSGLPSQVRQCVKDRTIENLVDPQLKEADEDIYVPKEEFSRDSLYAFSEITSQCVAEAQANRPTIEIIIKELERSLHLQEDHEIWKPRLPKDYEKICEMSKTEFKFRGNEISDKPGRIKNFYDLLCKGFLFQDGKTWFSLGSKGRRNVMISAKKYSYTNRSLRKWQSIPESRFHVVAQMLDILNLKIRIKLKPQLLLPGDSYGVHLVFKFHEPRKCLAKRRYVNLKYKIGNDNFQADFATWREDGWMMIELCRIFNYEEDTDFKVLLLESFSRYYCGSKSVYIQGIEFRTIDNEEYEEVGSKEIEKYEDIQKLKEEQQDIDKEFLLKQVQKENIYFILSERKVPFDYSKRKDSWCRAESTFASIAKPFHLKYSAEWRFQGEIELLKQQVFGIKDKIESQMLSTDTHYMCYLVFKLSENCRGLHCPVRVRHGLKRENKEIGLICFRTPDPWNLPDTNGAPKERDDGLMEVLVWKFNSNSELKNDHIHMNLKFITYEGTMSGLILRGLEIRPV